MIERFYENFVQGNVNNLTEVLINYKNNFCEEMCIRDRIYCEPIEYTGFNKIPRPIRKALGVFAENCLPRGMKGRSFLIRHSKTLEERYIGNAYIFTEKEAGRLLKNSRRPDTMKVTAPIYERVKDKDPVTKMQYLDMHLWLVHDILMKGDKLSLIHILLRFL